MLLKATLVAVVLAGSLALKLPANHTPVEAGVDPLRATLITTALFLKKHAITVRHATQDLDLIVMQGERPDGCRLRVAVMAPQGWHSGVVRNLARPGDDVFFAYGGAIYPEQPTWRTRMDLYTTLILRRFGAAPAQRTVLGVIADTACNARALPWGDVAILPDAADLPKETGS